jgi:uncharacterized protein YegJ (DUF2314 family)
MSEESPLNIGFVCATCAPRANPKAQTHSPAFYIGRHVKLEFADRTSPRKEHMWVLVQSYKDSLFTGTLDNEPMLDVGVPYGGTVHFRRNDIEDITS